MKTSRLSKHIPLNHLHLYHRCLRLRKEFRAENELDWTLPDSSLLVHIHSNQTWLMAGNLKIAAESTSTMFFRSTMRTKLSTKLSCSFTKAEERTKIG